MDQQQWHDNDMPPAEVIHCDEEVDDEGVQITRPRLLLKITINDAQNRVRLQQILEPRGVAAATTEVMLCDEQFDGQGNTIARSRLLLKITLRAEDGKERLRQIIQPQYVNGETMSPTGMVTEHGGKQEMSSRQSLKNKTQQPSPHLHRNERIPAADTRTNLHDSPISRSATPLEKNDEKRRATDVHANAEIQPRTPEQPLASSTETVRDDLNTLRERQADIDAERAQMQAEMLLIQEDMDALQKQRSHDTPQWMEALVTAVEAEVKHATDAQFKRPSPDLLTTDSSSTQHKLAPNNASGGLIAAPQPRTAAPSNPPDDLYLSIKIYTCTPHISPGKISQHIHLWERRLNLHTKNTLDDPPTSFPVDARFLIATDGMLEEPWLPVILFCSLRDGEGGFVHGISGLVPRVAIFYDNRVNLQAWPSLLEMLDTLVADGVLSIAEKISGSSYYARGGYMEVAEIVHKLARREFGGQEGQGRLSMHARGNSRWSVMIPQDDSI